MECYISSCSQLRCLLLYRCALPHFLGTIYRLRRLQLVLLHARLEVHRTAVVPHTTEPVWEMDPGVELSWPGGLLARKQQQWRPITAAPQSAKLANGRPFVLVGLPGLRHLVEIVDLLAPRSMNLDFHWPPSCPAAMLV